jgi:hypothetical protein
LAFHSGREADHSPPYSAEVKEWVELYLHSPNVPSWRGAPLVGAQGQLRLFLPFATSASYFPLQFVEHTLQIANLRDLNFSLA